MGPAPGEVTELLQRFNEGDKIAASQIITLVYDELHRLAGACMRRERIDHTLQPTALVHEVWLRLVDQREWKVEDRAHFFRIATLLMRRILIDHARASNAEKRGGSFVVVSLESGLNLAIENPGQLLDVHGALERLQNLDPRRAQIAELRFFGGLSMEEIAEVQGVTSRTVNRQWRAARAWLGRELASGIGAAEGSGT